MIDKKAKMICSNPMCPHKGHKQGMFNFYTIEKNGITEKYPMCKDCVKARINLNDMQTVYNFLRAMDIAFVPALWEKMVIAHPDNPFGNYLRAISNLKMYKGMHFAESQTLNVVIDNQALLDKAYKDKAQKKQVHVEGSNTTYIPADVLANYRSFWGEGYSAEEYVAMQHKYEQLKKSFPKMTALHIEGLRNYVIPRVKADICITRGDDAQAKSWLEIADKAAKAAKLNVAQLSNSELDQTTNSFAIWCKKVEETADVGSLIDCLSTFKYQPIDSVDFEIWCVINFYRHLSGKPDIPYEDVYKFYDKMKEDYITDTGDPYGIFENDPTNKMREKIKTFIKPLKDEEDIGHYGT